MRRRLVAYVVFFMMGIVSGLAGYRIMVLFAGTGLLFVKSLRKCSSEEGRFVMILVIMFLAGFIRITAADCNMYDKEMESHIGLPYTCYGYIKDIKPAKDGRFRIVAEVNGTGVLCYYKGEINNCYSITGRRILFTLRPGRAEGDFYARSSGCSYTSNINGFLLGDFVNSPFTQFKRRILLKQSHFTDRFKERNDSKGFLSGILFGNTSFMNEETRELFSYNGTAHILAVSGLHIGILYGFYKFVQKKLRKKLFTFIYLVLLFIYGTAAGWSVSVARAVIMILVLMTGELTDRPYDMLTAAFFSSFIILLKNPYYLFTAGFQMSFLAVVSIAFLMPLFTEYIGTYWSMVMAVQAGLLPYIMYTFDKCSLRGIVLNIPTVFLAGILVPAGVIAFFFYMISGISFKVIEYFLMNMADLIVWINSLFEGSEFLSSDITIASPFYLVLYYSCIFFVSSEFFTVHRLRKEYLMLAKVYFLFFMMAYILSISI